MIEVIKKIAIDGIAYDVAGGGSTPAGEDNRMEYLTQEEYNALSPEQKADTSVNYVIIGEGESGSIDAKDVTFTAEMSTLISDNVHDAIEEVFTNVSNGKELLADAITDKGVETSADDTFQEMAEKIGSLTVGGKYTSDSKGDLLFHTNAIHHSYNYNLLGFVTNVRFENGDDVYYGVFYYKYNKETMYTYVKYNQTKNKIYSYNGSYTHGSNNYSLTINYDYDNNRTWLCVNTGKLIGYFDSTNNFTLTDTGAGTLMQATGTDYSGTGIFYADMGQKVVTVLYKYNSTTYQHALISVAQNSWN